MLYLLQLLLGEVLPDFFKRRGLRPGGNKFDALVMQVVDGTVRVRHQRLTHKHFIDAVADERKVQRTELLRIHGFIGQSHYGTYSNSMS